MKKIKDCKTNVVAVDPRGAFADAVTTVKTEKNTIVNKIRVNSISHLIKQYRQFNSQK